jgi:hypothetical protein
MISMCSLLTSYTISCTLRLEHVLLEQVYHNGYRVDEHDDVSLEFSRQEHVQTYSIHYIVILACITPEVAVRARVNATAIIALLYSIIVRLLLGC